MRIMLKTGAAILAMWCLLIPANAQQNILTAGALAEGNGGSASWSVGMMCFTTYTGSEGDLFEGVQHPYELFFMTGQDDIQEAPDVMVYPIPAREEITVKFAYPQPLNRNIRIFDITGVMVRRVDASAGTVQVKLDNLAPAVYFLVIYEQDHPRGTLRIIRK